MSDGASADASRSELERLRTVLRLSDAAIAHSDRDLVVQWANDACARLFGRASGTLAGVRLADLVGAAAARAIAGALDAAAPGVAVDTEVELDQPAFAGRILCIRHEPVDGATDRPSGWVQTLRDVTAERLGEPVARLAAIVASSDDAIIGKTLTGIITSWNEGARRLFGYTADEMIGQPIQRIMPADRVSDMYRILARIRDGQRIEHFETERVRKDGERIQVSLSVSPIRDASGRIVGAAKIARDVTERRRAETALASYALENARLYQAERQARAEAEAASRAKDDLLSVVSHELRTPLTSIMGWVTLLRQDKLDADGVRRALETIERNGRVQRELIDDLLDVSRIVNGQLYLELEHVDLRTPCEAAIETLRPDAAAKGVQIDAALASATVVGDATRLQQVVSNLVANAVKFTPAGGHVRVSLTRDAARATIVVRDDGVGIEPAFLPLVFEPFKQAEDVRKRKCGGLGLGLTIVRNLVEQQGGTVAVASDGADRGVVVTVVLPLAATARPALADGATVVEHAAPE
jgi:PAS domain S-box-containing protein